jgi:hypothetical protein
MFARADARSVERSKLAELLRCPACGAGVAIDVGEAACTTGAHVFPVVDDVIVMTDETALAADPHYARQRQYFDDEFTTY